MVENSYVGSGAANVRKIFKEAKEAAPSIVFFDEFDAIAGKREVNTESHASTRSTINELLSEFDGFDQNSGVFVMAATNFPESLDPAVVRPGRFDRILRLPSPSAKGREKLLRHFLSNIRHADNIDIKKLSQETLGLNGADIKTLINLAILTAIKAGRTEAEQKDFDFAVDRVRVGILNKSHKPSLEEKYKTAIHEAGHTVAALMNPHAMPLDKVTILSKGGALG